VANFFSSPWFLEAAAQVFFGGRGVHPGTVEVQGRLYDVLLRRDGSVVDAPLLDYLEPRDPGEGSPASIQAVRGLPAVARELVEVAGAGLDPGPWLPAPRIQWSGFSSFDAFQKVCSRRSSNAFKRHARKLAALAAEVGPTRFAWGLRDHRLLEDLLLWKSRQLRQTGRPDRFASVRNRQFLHLLLDRGYVQIAALFAGERAIALDFGPDDGATYASWIAGYNVDYARYSPGILLFEEAMRVGWERGQRCFDFLGGGEAYKLHYATHAWLVGPVGTLPALTQVRRGVRAWITEHENDSPARAGAFRAARWVLDQRLRAEGLADAAPEAAWRDRIELDQQAWPHGRLEERSDCQLDAMLAWGARDFSPFAPRLALSPTRVRQAGRSLREKIHAWRQPPAGGQEPLKVASGEYVRVLPSAQIRATLLDGQVDSLCGPVDVDRFSGRAFRVARRVGRFYHAVQGRVVDAGDAVLLEGVCCDGAPARSAGGCDRACPLVWSPRWLERSEAPPVAPAPAPTPQVRIRSLEAIVQAGDGGGVRFIPALMAPFAGREFQVGGRVRKVHDERRRVVVEIGGALWLEGVRCPGARLVGGGRCGRGCALLWREEWVEGIEGSGG
jgi:hypothetical protein